MEVISKAMIIAFEVAFFSREKLMENKKAPFCM